MRSLGAWLRPAADEAVEEDDNGRHQKDVDYGAANMKAEAQQPQDQ